MFLSEPDITPARRDFYDEDLHHDGYVANATRAWAWLPESRANLYGLMVEASRAGNLSYRDAAILVTATASRLGDSYCSLAWGTRLASSADPGKKSKGSDSIDSPYRLM